MGSITGRVPTIHIKIIGKTKQRAYNIFEIKVIQVFSPIKFKIKVSGRPTV